MITYIIIAVTVAISYKGFQDRSFFYRFDFSPYQIEKRKEWYRFISHGFLHADWSHLFFNMFVLWTFSSQTINHFEYHKGAFGMGHFILLYLGGITFATLTTFKKQKDNPNYHSIGASGAVSAVLFSYIIFQPLSELRLIIFPFFGLPSVVWGIAYLVYSHYQSKRNNDHINHDAHLSGALFGMIYTLIVVPQSFDLFINQLLSILNF